MKELIHRGRLEKLGPDLDLQHPMSCRWAVYQGGFVAPPHLHSFCELTLPLSGSIRMFAGGEEARRDPGDLFLGAPGLPHWGKVIHYPIRYFVVHFQPWMLVDFGAHRDGARILNRFVAPQTIKQRIIQSDQKLRLILLRSFKKMVAEYSAKAFGWELKMRSQLLEMLVELIRWEDRKGFVFQPRSKPVNWHQLERALAFIQARHAENFYGRELARGVGVSESSLQVLFQNALGMPWVQYLQAFRIQRAAALLAEPSRSVTDVAFDVGFQSLSHFNVSFRKIMKMTPMAWRKQVYIK